MKVYPITPVIFAADQKISTKQTAPTQKAKATNLLPVTYPANYYISFKSDVPMSDAHKYYLEYADKLYEKNKNTPLQKVDDQNIRFDLISALPSESFILNKKTRDLIINFIDNKKQMPQVDNTFIKNSIEAGLTAIESSETADMLFQKGCKRRIVYPWDKARYDYKEFHDKGFSYAGIFTRLSSLLDTTKIKDCKNPYELDTYRRKFGAAVDDYIKENYKQPIFDKKLLTELKEEINNFEPMKEYDKKILEVKAQEVQNKNISCDKYAQDIYDDIINKHVPPFENEKFYEYLTKNSAKLDFQLEKLYGFYTDNYREIFDSLNIDKKHKILLADPGVAFNILELGTFVDTNHIDTKNISPFELRKKFSDYLGTETVYRGVQPTGTNAENLAEKIKETGNFAAAFKTKQKVIDSIKYYLDAKEDRGYTHFSKIIEKIKYRNKESAFLSVSSEYDIAASVPKSSDNKKSVVIKAKVPVLSLLKQKDEYRNMQTSRRHDILRVGYRCFDYDTQQEKIEAFIPFYIAPENIEISIDTETPTFSWEGD